MANSPQALKRIRQNQKRNQHNTHMRSMMRTAVKKVIREINAGDQAQARDAYREAEPLLDRMARKGLIHKNKSARHKSRLGRRIAQMGQAEQTETS